MALLDNFTKEEREQLLQELKAEGYDVREFEKGNILNQEARDIYKCETFIGGDIRHAIDRIASAIADVKGKRTVEADKAEAYREVVRAILRALHPYLGLRSEVAFRRKSQTEEGQQNDR